MPTDRQTLASYVDALEQRGRHIFLREEAIRDLNVSKDAFKLAANRLRKKNRIAGTRGGFFIIIPMQYRKDGSLPPTWFIDALMKFHARPYYVGILSAAELHGAAHQRPQVFQVVTDGPIWSTSFSRTRIQFFTRKNVEKMPTQEMKATTGHFRVSTPETTAIDLLRYYHGAGHLSNVATVLIELAEVIDPKKLVQATKTNGEIPLAQRLGYLLDHYSQKRLTHDLATWISRKDLRPVLLSPDSPKGKTSPDKKWNVIPNIDVEPDL